MSHKESPACPKPNARGSVETPLGEQLEVTAMSEGALSLLNFQACRLRFARSIKSQCCKVGDGYGAEIELQCPRPFPWPSCRRCGWKCGNLAPEITQSCASCDSKTPSRCTCRQIHHH